VAGDALKLNAWETEEPRTEIVPPLALRVYPGTVPTVNG
jgi:hypothetical protein